VVVLIIIQPVSVTRLLVRVLLLGLDVVILAQPILKEWLVEPVARADVNLLYLVVLMGFAENLVERHYPLLFVAVLTTERVIKFQYVVPN